MTEIPNSKGNRDLSKANNGNSKNLGSTEMKVIDTWLVCVNGERVERFSNGIVVAEGSANSGDFLKTQSCIRDLRDPHQRIGGTAAEAYGWGDLDLEHGFHEVDYLPANDRVSFTISEKARLEVQRTLARLNKERYEAEVEQGLHGEPNDTIRTRRNHVSPRRRTG